MATGNSGKPWKKKDDGHSQPKLSKKEYENRGRGSQFKPKEQQADQSSSSSKQRIELGKQEKLKNDYEQLDHQIERSETQKKNAPVGIESSFTKVRNRGTVELQNIPDISAHWIDKTEFLPFLPQDNEVTSDNEEIIRNINLDLSKLLKKKYNHFWSQIVHDESLRTFLDSYLRYKRRPYEPHPDEKPSSPLLLAHESLYKRVFSVILRISTHQESALDFMDRKYFAQLILDKNLFDVPKLFDICVLYGGSNKDLVRNLVTGLFLAQPELSKQLEKLVPNVANSLKDVQAKLLAKPSAKESEDLWKYLQDSLCSITSFLVIYPEAGHFFQDHSFLQQMPHLYEAVLAAYPRSSDQFSLQLMKASALSLSNSILQHCYFGPITNLQQLAAICSRCKPLKREKVGEELVQLLNFFATAVGEDSSATFLKDFSKKYALQFRIDEAGKSGIKLESDYIMQTLAHLCGPYEPPKTEAALPPPQPNKASDDAPAMDPVVKASLIAQVRDLLPDLGEGFVEACLVHYKFSTEEVINHLLEENLPNELKKLDRKMKTFVNKSKPPAKTTPRNDGSLLVKRANVFDNDEFDIVTNVSIDKSKVHKKNTREASKSEVKSILNDRSLVTQAEKARISEYQYEDEYDDSFDEFVGKFQIGSEQTRDQNNQLVDSQDDTADDDDDEPAKSTSKKDSDEDEDDETEASRFNDASFRGKPSSSAPSADRPTFTPNRGRGRGLPARNEPAQPQGASPGQGEAASRGRGRGSRGNKSNAHHRKDRSIQKRTGFVTRGQ